MSKNIHPDCTRLRVLCAALLAAFPLLANAGIAGRFQFVAGDVRVIGIDSKERPAQKGHEVDEGETLLSGPGASAQLKMIDGGLIAVRPDTRMKLDIYNIQGSENGKEKAFISLLKGGFRAITGLIGKTNKENYTIGTSTATIGIRGTDHEPMVILPPPPGVQPTHPPGTYDKVNVGATSLTTLAGSTLISPSQVGFAASPNQLPVILPKVPDFYQAASAPQAKQEQKKNEKQETAKQESTKPDSKAASNGTGSNASGSAAESTDAIQLTAAQPASTLLTGTDSSGNTLNTATQTTTTSSGVTTALTSATASATKNKQPGAVLLAAFPAPYANWLSLSGSREDLTLSKNTSGQVIGATASYNDYGLFKSNTTYVVSGGVSLDSGADASSGLAWGRWQGGQVNYTSTYFGQDASGAWGIGAHDSNNTFVIGNTYSVSSNLGSSSAHWITGQGASPNHLARILTGTATYNLVGGTQPTDTAGNVGTLNHASLSANFTAQAVTAGVDFTIGGNHWLLQGSGLPLQGDTGFYAKSCGGCPMAADGYKLSTFSKNGVAVNTNGSADLNGQLFGAGLSSAAFQYSVIDYFTAAANPNVIQGVVGFSGPTQNAATPYRIVAIEDNQSGNFGSGGYYSTAALPYGYIGTPESFTGYIHAREAPVSRVVDSASGLTEFVGSATYVPTGITTNPPTFNHAETATIKIGTAVNQDVGSTTIGSTPISWGRWAGGSVDIYSQDGSSKLGSIGNANKSIHWITSGTLTGPINASLPLTGTATYVLAGHTQPTDFQGNTGTLGSAALNADFSTMLMSSSVTASFTAPTPTTWSMTASNIPIGKDGGFGSSTLTNVSGATHTATCSGSTCGSQTTGNIGGSFIGSAAAGAVLSYRMATGTAATSASNFIPNNGVVGLAIFKK